MGLLAVSACFDEVPFVEMTAVVFEPVTPPIAPEDDIATIQWNLLASPEGSEVTGLPSTKPRPMLELERRGQYVLDRWIYTGLSERLTHYVVITVSGSRPLANIAGPGFVTIGQAAYLDGRGTVSPEARSLTYLWRLERRPAQSQLVLAAELIDDAVLAFMPDVAGEYVIELVAFDGELWSQPTMITVEGRP